MAFVSPGVAVVAAGLAAVSIAVSFYYRTTKRVSELVGAAYVLRNSTSHVRYMPVHHTFTYPMHALLVSLKSLESKKLDLGWLFAYAPRYKLGQLTALEPNSYLRVVNDSHASISSKLDILLRERNLITLADGLGETWMLTMPSIAGFVGINPLTVYYCYDKVSGDFSFVVLEIHNTFGERHVYICVAGFDEDPHQLTRFAHQWTFPRQFHVSPFNDRGGYYTASVTPPLYPPHHPSWSFKRSDGESSTPRPTIRITLTTPIASKKFSAVLRVTSSNILSRASLSRALLSAPFDLFITFPRIAYEAYILHYKKRLDVYARPEPHASLPPVEKALGPSWNATELQLSDERNLQMKGGTITWRDAGFTERWCQARLKEYLSRRVEDDTFADVSVELIYSDSSVPIQNFPQSATERPRKLEIYYRSPRFFTIMFQCRTAQEVLALGARGERLFSTSDDALFIAVLTFAPSHSNQITWAERWADSIRSAWIQSTGQSGYPKTSTQEQDSKSILHHPQGSSVAGILILYFLFVSERAEKSVFGMLDARFVRGDEPWAGWERTAKAMDARTADKPEQGHLAPHRALGSVMRKA